MFSVRERKEGGKKGNSVYSIWYTSSCDTEKSIVALKNDTATTFTHHTQEKSYQYSDSILWNTVLLTYLSGKRTSTALHLRLSTQVLSNPQVSRLKSPGYNFVKRLIHFFYTCKNTEDLIKIKWLHVHTILFNAIHLPVEKEFCIAHKRQQQWALHPSE